MPTLPASLSNPGLLLALCLIVGLVVGVNATLISLFRRRPGRSDQGQWSRALGGARERQRQQADQLEQLHRAVTKLAAPPPDPKQPHE